MRETRWDEKFLGRERELKELVSAWKKAKNNQPQLMLMLADSGYGKTRLIQEFYNWLSQEEDAKDPNGYWPDDLGRDGNSLNVNPKFTDYQPEPVPSDWTLRSRS